MKQLYLSGAISNNPDYKQDFENAYNKLHKAGYSAVLNPVEFCKGLEDWEDCMRKCIFILSRHKNVSLAKIETPYPSKGCDLELQIAEALGLEIKTVDEWIELIEQQHQFRFCHQCGYDFNSELINEYEIKHCPKCGANINNTVEKSIGGESMKTTDNAYEAITDCLMQIENTAVGGALNKKDARDCCLEIKSLVFKTRQVLNENFYISENEPDM